TADKERPYSVFAGAGGTELSAVEGASSGACPLAPVAGAGEPRAAKTSFARSISGVLKFPSSILKSSPWAGFVALTEAASLFGLVRPVAASVGLFTAPGWVGSGSGPLVLGASCLAWGASVAGAAAAAKGLAAPAVAGPGAGAGLLAGGALEASPTLAGALGLSTAPWLARTLEDKLLAAGAEVGVSLRSTRGATLGAEGGGGEEVATPGPLEGVAWPAGTEFESGVAVAGGAILEVRVVVSLVGLF
uniref:Uncharacterized protein n=1 Tax=Ursus americanus TaxID=9643 RepID=A0A452SB25_URSAM